MTTKKILVAWMIFLLLLFLCVTFVTMHVAVGKGSVSFPTVILALFVIPVLTLAQMSCLSHLISVRRKENEAQEENTREGILLQMMFFLVPLSIGCFFVLDRTIGVPVSEVTATLLRLAGGAMVIIITTCLLRMIKDNADKSSALLSALLRDDAKGWGRQYQRRDRRD